MAEKAGKTLALADIPFTCEISPAGIKLYHCVVGDVFVGRDKKPGSVTVGGEKVKFRWDGKKSGFVVSLPAGESTVLIK